MNWPQSVYTESEANARALNHVAKKLFDWEIRMQLELDQPRGCFHDRAQELIVRVEDCSWAMQRRALQLYCEALVAR